MRSTFHKLKKVRFFQSQVFAFFFAETAKAVNTISFGLNNWMAKSLAVFCCTLFFALITDAQTCGLDLFVANDQSGSVDSRENFQSRDFITRLGEVGTLGNPNSQNRVAVANWAYTNTFIQYNFPTAGAGYTINIADLLAYRESVRTLSGNTDPYQALQKAYQNISLTPVSGRNVRRVIVLMTDAYDYQVQPGIEQLATQIKNAGIYIAVMAIDAARNVAKLSGTKVASPNLYFNAFDYATLQSTALQKIGDLMNYSCSQPAPSWDLTVNITSVNCTTGAVNYTVTNNSGTPFSGTLSTSFYNGDPTMPSTKLLSAHTVGGTTTIGANASANFTFASSAIIGKANLQAVVNINTASNQNVPPINHNISSVLLVAGEGNGANNISIVFNASNCTVATPVLEVSKKVAAVNCDLVTYDVQVCNTGNATANNVVVTDYPQSSNLVFQSTSGTQGVGNKYITNIAEDGYWAAINPPNTSVVHYANTTTVAERSYSGTTYPNDAQYFYYPTYSFNGGIPKNTSISSAKLIVTVQGDATGVNHNTTNLYDVFGHKYSSSPLSQVPTVQDYYINSPGTVTASYPNYTDGSLGNTANVVRTLEIDVTTIVQGLVNQGDWTMSKYFSFLIKHKWDRQNLYGNSIYYFNEHANAAYRPQLIIETNNPTLSLAPGECKNISFIYKATSSITASNNSAGVTTTTANTKYLPNTNFTVGTNTGLNGYNGAVNTGDEATVTLPCTSPTLSPLSNAVSINSFSTCNDGGFIKAQVIISNPNPTIIRNTLLQLNLAGTNAKFAGEPYAISNGLKLATPDVLNTAYPNVNYALLNKTGIVSLPIYEIPASGSVSLDIDLAISSTDASLASTVTSIPAIYNGSGQTTTATQNVFVTLWQTPTVSFSNCPTSVTAATGTITLNATTTGAGSVTIRSATSATALTNSNTVAAPSVVYTISPEDIANGYATISITAISSSGGCESTATCQFKITSVVYDYGDAPSQYDFGKNTVPTAAASTPLTGLYLGSIQPSTEAFAKQSANALGDGIEEDGLIAYSLLPDANQWAPQIKVTNTSASVGYLTAYTDFNGDGDFLDANEKSNTVTIAANSGVTTVNPTFTVPASYTCGSNLSVRLRLSTLQANAERPYAPAPGGETEDYIITTMLDKGNLPSTWPEGYATMLSADLSSTGRVWLGQNNGYPNTSCASNISKNDGFTISEDNQVSGSGSAANPFLLNVSYPEDYLTFNVTVNGSIAGTPVYWGVWYDANSNGSFTDADDVFAKGVTTTGSPVTTQTGFLLKNGGTNGGAAAGKIRVVATAANADFSKAQNGQVAVINGEVEDYYVEYLTILPVSITKFDAVRQGNTALLKWETASEENTAAFAVERKNGNTQAWQNIGTVTADGNSSDTRLYTFIDKNIIADDNYYRLKIIDKDGKTSYSQIRNLKFYGEGGIQLQPNPANGFIAISGLEVNSSIQLLDIGGRVLQTIKTNTNKHTIKVNMLAKGIYMIKVQGSGPVQVTKFIKE